MWKTLAEANNDANDGFGRLGPFYRSGKAENFSVFIVGEITAGSVNLESKFAGEENSAFAVQAIYDGTVFGDGIEVFEKVWETSGGRVFRLMPSADLAGTGLKAALA